MTTNQGNGLWQNTFASFANGLHSSSYGENQKKRNSFMIRSISCSGPTSWMPLQSVHLGNICYVWKYLHTSYLAASLVKSHFCVSETNERKFRTMSFSWLDLTWRNVTWRMHSARQSRAPIKACSFLQWVCKIEEIIDRPWATFTLYNCRVSCLTNNYVCVFSHVYFTETTVISSTWSSQYS